MAEGKRVDVEKLTNFSAKALEKLNVPPEDAMVTARMLITSDLRGVDSHGVAHLKPFYVKWIQTGVINPRPNPQVFSQALSTAVIDGDNGLGFVIGHQAMMEAIHRAEKTGAGFVAVRNSTHFGAAAPYAMMALEHDMVGMAMTNTAAGVVAPGSSKSAVGTNPLAVAIPAGKKPPFVLDMATSVISYGKVEIALREGTPIPEGWVIDKEGRPIIDPAKKVRGEGGLLPLGGTPKMGSYKGFGLGVLVDILCGVLSGSSASVLWKLKPGTLRNDFFFGALRIDSFIALDKFKQGMDEMIEAVEALPKLPGVKKVYVAGGYEAEIVKDREANGIPLHPNVVASLQEVAKELNIEYNLY